MAASSHQWLLWMAASSHQSLLFSMLYLLFHHYLHSSYFLPLLVVWEKMLLKFWHISESHVRRHQISTSFSGNWTLFLSLHNCHLFLSFSYLLVRALHHFLSSMLCCGLHQHLSVSQHNDCDCLPSHPSNLVTRIHDVRLSPVTIWYDSTSRRWMISLPDKPWGFTGSLGKPEWEEMKSPTWNCFLTSKSFNFLRLNFSATNSVRSHYWLNLNFKRSNKNCVN
jgi:hypothetical protein